MPVFTHARPTVSIRPNDVPGDCWFVVSFMVYDSDTGQNFDDTVDVLIGAGDNAQQVEVKIRDACFDKATQSGVTCEVANFFMAGYRRG